MLEQITRKYSGVCMRVFTVDFAMISINPIGGAAMTAATDATSSAAITRNEDDGTKGWCRMKVKEDEGNGGPHHSNMGHSIGHRHDRCNHALMKR